jgi:hypothetical protein
MLTDAHKETRKAITTDILLQYDTAGEGIPRKQKLRVCCWLGSVIVTVFWDEKGVVHVNFLPRGATVNF